MTDLAIRTLTLETFEDFAALVEPQGLASVALRVDVDLIAHSGVGLVVGFPAG